MPRSLPALLHKKGVLIASGTAILVAVGGGTTAAFASTGDSTAATATTVSCHVHHGKGFFRDMPAALKADLKDLRSLPKGSAERKAERQTIVKEARAGDFGTRYEHVFRAIERHHHRFAEAFSKLPANLQSDIKALRELPKGDGQRKAAWQQIEQKALAGDYGTAIQARAEKREAHKAACAATATPSSSPSASTGS